MSESVFKNRGHNSSCPFLRKAIVIWCSPFTSRIRFPSDDVCVDVVVLGYGDIISIRDFIFDVADVALRDYVIDVRDFTISVGVEYLTAEIWHEAGRCDASSVVVCRR